MFTTTIDSSILGIKYKECAKTEAQDQKTLGQFLY